MARVALILVLATVLAACASTDTVTVRVPTYQRPEPPPELLEPVATPIGVFVPPGEGEAVACLPPAGKDLLVNYVDTLRRRVAAWEAWAQ